MKVLIVSKTSKYSQMTPEAVAFLPPQTMERMRLAHEEHEETLSKTKVSLRSLGVQIEHLARGERFSAHDYDLVFAIGGDGTFLAASHQIQDSHVLLVGIKSSHTSVGHLCYGRLEALQPCLSALLKDPSKSGMKLQRFHMELSKHGGKVEITPPVMNDVLFCHQDPAETTRYQLQLNGKESEEQKSSGLWLATPSGSTAVISTTGGRPLPLASRFLQLKVRELYSPRPARIHHEFLDPSKDQCEILNLTDASILAVDGSYTKLSVALGESLRLKAAEPLRAFVRTGT
jgi:NAD+ kinase